MSRALLVFAKTPVSGAVKTRLAGVLGADGARELYSAFVRDMAASLATLNQSGAPRIRIRWHVTPDPEPLRDLIGHGELFKQSGETLGSRMRAAFEAASGEGYESVVIIGTDTPTLSREVIGRAFELLDTGGGAVLGPASDGGYYLLGLRDVDPAFLEAVSYSHPKVLTETAAHLTASGNAPAYLPELFDVDRPADLSRLQALLEAKPSLAPCTAQFLQNRHALDCKS